MHRWLRVLVCLLLICALLINLSPLRAKASGAVATGVAVGVAVAIGVAAIMNAAGVRQGVDYSTFNEIVGNCVDALSPEWAVDGMVTFLALSSGSVTKTYASRIFLQAVLDWMFGEGEVLSSGLECSTSHYLASTLFACSDISTTVPTYVCWYTADGLIYESVYSLSENFYFTCGASNGWASPYGSVYARSIYTSYDGDEQLSSMYLGDFSEQVSDDTYAIYYVMTNVVGSIENKVSTTKDLTLESVGQDVDTDYKTYVDTGIVDIEWGVHFEDPSGDDENHDIGIPGVPVRIPSLDSDVYIDQTQQEAQTGDTHQDVLDELLQQSGSGGSGTGTGDGSGSGNTGNSGSTWVPPSSHNQFALVDLSKYFPFCIPFDLYDFFTLLDAEPVAPVLSWEIQDLSGQSYSLSVDLSEWDSVAQLFRRLQLSLKY